MLRVKFIWLSSSIYKVKIILRALFFAAFLGSLYWIRVHPEEPQPYVSTILCVAALLGTFYESKNRKTNIVPRLVERQTIRGGKSANSYYLLIHNDGEVKVKDFLLQIQLRDGQGCPLTGDREARNSLRIPILHPNQNYEYPMIISFDTGVEFDIIWSWRISCVRREEKTGILRLEGK